MTTLVKDETYGGWVEGVRPTGATHTLELMSPTQAIGIAWENGIRRPTSVLVSLQSEMKYVEPASGVDGGWKRVYTTQGGGA